MSERGFFNAHPWWSHTSLCVTLLSHISSENMNFFSLAGSKGVILWDVLIHFIKPLKETALFSCRFNQENAVEERGTGKKCLAFCFGMLVNHIRSSLIISFIKCSVNGIGIDILIVTYPVLGLQFD